LKLCLEWIVPARTQHPTQHVKSGNRPGISAHVATGELTPMDAETFSRILDVQPRAINIDLMGLNPLWPRSNNRRNNGDKKRQELGELLLLIFQSGTNRMLKILNQRCFNLFNQEEPPEDGRFWVDPREGYGTVLVHVPVFRLTA
jgi:hypothetical protein